MGLGFGFRALRPEVLISMLIRIGVAVHKGT